MKYFFVICLFWFMCIPYTQTSNSIKKIIVVSLPKHMETPLAISELRHLMWYRPLLSDTTITDTILINRFAERFEKLKEDTTYWHHKDIRIVCFIEHSPHYKLDTLCMEEYGALFLNNVRMQKDSVLSKLIMDKVWKDLPDEKILEDYH